MAFAVDEGGFLVMVFELLELGNCLNNCFARSKIGFVKSKIGFARSLYYLPGRRRSHAIFAWAREFSYDFVGADG